MITELQRKNYIIIYFNEDKGMKKKGKGLKKEKKFKALFRLE